MLASHRNIPLLLVSLPSQSSNVLFNHDNVSSALFVQPELQFFSRICGWKDPVLVFILIDVSIFIVTQLNLYRIYSSTDGR